MTSRSVRLAVVTLALLAGACARHDQRPNIVLVSIDTLRSDALRAYDPAARPLPALDTLAARSARFSHALAAAAWTLPSHASLLTGVYPSRHGAVHRDATISPEAPSLASLLAARGYETVAFTDGGFLDTSYGFGRGFMRYDDRVSRGVERLPSLPAGGKPSAEGESDLFARADAFLAQRKPERPLFLFVHTYAVHDYYKAHPWARPAAGTPTATDPDANLDCLTGKRTCSPEHWEALAGYYRAELERLDGALGALLATTRSSLGGRPTYVVLLSDHGEGLDPELGATHHGGTLRRDVLAVPLLVSGPGVSAGTRSTPVSLVDVAPTLVALAGARDADFDGSSLAPLLFGGVRERVASIALAHRSLRAEEHYYWWRDGRRLEARDVPTRALAVGVLRGGWWYTEAPREELAERLVGKEHDAPPMHALRRAAESLLRSEAVASPRHVESAELDATLRSLGYTGGGAP
jgi:arylsulfatase A-like enzyme